MGMADEVKKAVKQKMPGEKAAKEAANATLQALAKTDAQKAAANKAPAAVEVRAKASVAVKTPSGAAVKVEEKPVMVAPKVVAAKAPEAKPDVPKTEALKAEPQKAPEAKPLPKVEAAKAEPVKAAASEEAPKVESKKEADPNKEFVDGIMAEMALKGGSKKRLIKMLGEQLNFDKQKVMFRLKRALITERYAAAHAESGH
jgi:membrane protein involved in colicin uptake